MHFFIILNIGTRVSVIFRGLGPGGGVWAEMDKIYDLQVIYYSIKKITLSSHMQDEICQYCIFSSQIA